MRLGLGVLRWSSAQFWSSTVVELYSAIEGWQDSHGVERAGKGPTPKELKDLMERFPDEHPG